MSFTHTYDAAIVGAGVAGSAAAITLARMGWSTVVFDRDLFPRHKVCGEFLSPESADMLATLGADKPLRALVPGEIERARLVLASGRTLEVMLPGTGVGVSRHALDTVLLRQAEAEGAYVRTGVTVTSVTAGARGYELRIVRNGDTEQVEARAVIAAWGRRPHSGLASRPRPSAKGGYAGYVGVKCHYEGLPRVWTVELYMFPGGYAGVAPIEGERTNVAALVTMAAFREAGRSIEKLLHYAAAANPAFGLRLAGGRLVPGTACAVAPVDTARGLQPWAGMPLVGDAAAVIPPLCGDGMAIALRTAERCAALTGGRLRGELSPQAWRRAYEAALRRELAGPLRAGRLLQAALLRPRLAAALLRLGTAAPSLAGRVVRATRLSPE